MTRRLLPAVLLLLAVSPLPAEAARKATPTPPPTLQDLAKVPVTIDRNQPVTTDPTQATQSYEDFLKIEGTDPALRAQALRRVGDLKLASAEALRGEEGTASAAATAAANDAIAAYQRLLRDYPQYPETDAVLYQLARAYETVGDSAKATQTLDQLVTRFPDKAHYDEAQFRRGESYFAAQKYAEAEGAYAAVLTLGTASEFYEQALYKRGWSLLKLSRDVESSESFLKLLDRLLLKDGKVRPASDLSRPERELNDDTLRALSVMFAASDGVAALEAALAAHGPTPYESQLYRALGDLYVEKERYQDGAETYRAYARRRPSDPEAPVLLGLSADAFAKGGFSSRVMESKAEMVEQYGPKSAYWQSHGGKVEPSVDAAVQKNLLDLAHYHHALAQKSGSSTDRDTAVRWYREYLEGFNSAPEAAATRLFLADLLFEGKRYVEAAQEYEQAAYTYANATEAGRAGYAALVSYDKAEPQLPEAERPALRLKAVDSSLRFASTFPSHPETPAVLTRTTKVLFDAGDRERAEAVAQQVLALGPRADTGQQLVAWTVLAHTYFDSGRFADAEKAYGEVLARLPAKDPLRAEITERRAASVYRQAEAKQASGDTAGAVGEFLRVASVAPGSPAGAKAQYDAAALLLTNKQWNQAATVLEGFRKTYPQSELQPDVTRKLAVAYLEGGRSREAAAEFERVAAREEEDAEVRRAAQWQAAELYRDRRRHGLRDARLHGVREAVSRAVRRRARSAPRAGGPRDEIGRPGGTQALAGRDCCRRCQCRRRAHRPQPIPCSERDTRTCGAARCGGPRHPSRDPARQVAARQAQGDGSGARRLYGGRGLRRRAGFDAGHLRDGGPLSSPGQVADGIRQAAPPVRRRTRAVQRAARGAGLPVRGKGDRHPREEREACVRGLLGRVGREELRRARRDQAGTLRAARSRRRPGCAADCDSRRGGTACGRTDVARCGSQRRGPPDVRDRAGRGAGQRARAQPARRGQSPARPFRGRPGRVREGHHDGPDVRGCRA